VAGRVRVGIVRRRTRRAARAARAHAVVRDAGVAADMRACSAGRAGVGRAIAGSAVGRGDAGGARRTGLSLCDAGPAAIDVALVLIADSVRARVLDAGPAGRVETRVARNATARPVAGRMRVDVPWRRARRTARAARAGAGVGDAGIAARMRSGGAARAAAVRAGIREAAVAAEVRSSAAARAHVTGAVLARAIRRQHASRPVRAGLSLRDAGAAAIDAGFVLVLDRVAAGVREARSAA